VLSRKRQVQELFFESVSSRGVAQGTVVDAVELVESIGKVLKGLKAKSGITPKYVSAAISGQDIITKHSYAIIPLAERGNKVIMEYDLQRVIEQARILGSNLEEEIIHQIPAAYSIDAKGGIRNPLGLYSHKLEVDLYLICARLSLVQNITKVMNQAGSEIKHVLCAPIATSEVVFEPGSRSGTQVLCDIGKDVTEIIVFEDGMIKDMRVLALGGQDLTAEVAHQLQISTDLAEEIKKSHGAVGETSAAPDEKEILIKQQAAYKPIKRTVLLRILDDRAQGMCRLIKSSVESMVLASEVSSLVVTGRTLLMGGFIEAFEQVWGVPVVLGRIANPQVASLAHRYDILSGQKYLHYLTSLGVVCHLLRTEKPRMLANPQMYPHLFTRMVNKVKEVYLEYF
jgi:cell division protein FtsA